MYIYTYNIYSFIFQEKYIWVFKKQSNEKKEAFYMDGAKTNRGLSYQEDPEAGEI